MPLQAPPSAPLPDPLSLSQDGFASASDAYERGRPGYPDSLLNEMAAHWGLSEGSRVADIAAGTGKLSRHIIARGAFCVAVEPSASMRAECRRVLAGVELVGGSAESLPLASASFDLLTVAQAFHWFTAATALHEMARALRPDGVLMLVWNERDLSLEWTEALDHLMRRAGNSPHDPARELRPLFDGDPHFTPFIRWTGTHEVVMRASEVEDMVASRSYVQVLTPDDRESVLSRVRQLIAPLPEPLVMPYVTTAYCARARPGPCACTEEVSWSG